MNNADLYTWRWPIALALLAGAANAAAQSTTVGATVWRPPYEMEFRVFGAIPSSAWLSSQDILTTDEVVFAIDEACVTWSRVTGSPKRCRATGVGGVGVAINTGSIYQFSDTVGFNFQDHRNGIYFASRGPSDTGSFLALAECALPGGKEGEECDIWFKNDSLNVVLDSHNADVPWPTFINPLGGPSGTTYGAGATTMPYGAPPGTPAVPALPGAPLLPSFQHIALHEVGHTLGLWHIVKPGTVIPDSCDAANYHCPIMSGGTLANSYWPQIDDYEGMRDAHGLTPRELEWSVWSIDEKGSVVVRSGWRGFSPPLYSETPPRIACSPEEGEDNSARRNSCVMAIGRPGNTPRIRALSLSNTGFTVTASPVTAGLNSKDAEHAVDISYGNSNKYLAIAKRSPRDAAPTAIVTYAGTVNSPSLTPAIHDSSGTTNGFFTHTEPRISYHETSCHFVAAWPERNGAVHIATFDLDGKLKDDFLTRVFTRTPVELACDAHLPQNEPNCRLYVQTHDGSVQDKQARWQTFQVPIDNGGAPADACRTDRAYPARGLITLTDLQPAQGTWSESNRQDMLLIDTTTYGNGAEERDLEGGAYVLSSDLAPYQNMANDVVRLRVDRDGVSAGDISTRTLPMRNTGAVGLSNTTTWGWNEAGGRLIAVRTAKMK